MVTGKLISIFLIDAVPDGRLAGEISNWTGKAFKIPRKLLKESAKREELSKAGGYFLSVPATAFSSRPRPRNHCSHCCDQAPVPGVSRARPQGLVHVKLNRAT